MANHQSSFKRIRQAEKRKLHNRYYAKTARNAVRKLRSLEDKKEHFQDKKTLEMFC